MDKEKLRMLNHFKKYLRKKKYDFEKQFDAPPKETEEEKKERLEAAKIKNFEKQGLKKFDYQGRVIWTMNQKNADRKAKKKGIL